MPKFIVDFAKKQLYEIMLLWKYHRKANVIRHIGIYDSVVRAKYTRLVAKYAKCFDMLESNFQIIFYVKTDVTAKRLNMIVELSKIIFLDQFYDIILSFASLLHGYRRGR